MIKISNAKLKDIENLYSVYNETFVLHKHALPDRIIDNESKSDDISYLKHLISDKTYKIFIAHKDNEIVGYAIVNKVKEKSLIANIKDIGVTEKHHRKGIGDKLLQHIIIWCNKNKITKLELSVFAFNKKAIKFYKKNNFIPISHKMALDL